MSDSLSVSPSVSLSVPLSVSVTDPACIELEEASSPSSRLKNLEVSEDYEAKLTLLKQSDAIYANEKRLVAIKTDQIGSISFAAALLSAFGSTIIAQVIIPPPGTVDPTIMLMFGLLTSLEIGLSLLSLVMMTMILIGILNFDCRLAIKKEHSFEAFWANRCREDWILAYNFYVWSIYTFLTDLVFVALVQFQVVFATTYFVTAIVAITFSIMIFWIHPRWSSSVHFQVERPIHCSIANNSVS